LGHLKLQRGRYAVLNFNDKTKPNLDFDDKTKPNLDFHNSMQKAYGPISPSNNCTYVLFRCLPRFASGALFLYSLLVAAIIYRYQRLCSAYSE
jgi:hypothetical protein